MVHDIGKSGFRRREDRGAKPRDEVGGGGSCGGGDRGGDRDCWCNDKIVQRIDILPNRLMRCYVSL